MKYAPVILLLVSSPLFSQIPRAEAVDPALAANQANDFFTRAKNLYDAAQASTVMENRIDFYQRAAELFDRYINDFPAHPNVEMAYWYLGNSYYQSGRIDDGKRCFSTLLNRYGQGKWAAAAAYTLAADHYNKTEYAFAAPMFERYAANAAKPEDRPRGNFFAGNCYRLLGRHREAINAFKKVIEDPAGALFIPQSKIALGTVLLKDEKAAEALVYFEEVVGGPHAVKLRGEAALQAALTATKLGQTDLAEKYLQLVLTTEGMGDFRADAQTALMGNHFAKKQYREVIDIFRRSSIKAKGEKEAERLMIAARAHMGLKQPTEALTLFREVERLVNPQKDLAFHASYFRLLCFFQIEGHHVPDQVDAFLQLYRKARPDDRRIHTALMMKAETLFSKKEVEKAAKVYSEINAALLSDKDRPGLLYQRGWCLSEVGDPQGAIRSLSEFISANPKDSRVPTALAKRAKSYVEASEPDKALADFDRLTTAEGTPDDLVAFAWLESARMRRSEGNISDMSARYQALLKHGKALDTAVTAEANYWLGWGFVKSNNAKNAVPYLEKARELRPEAYGKHAGILLALGYFASQDPTKLIPEIHLAIKGDYQSDIPDQAVQWAGMQAYNSGDYKSAGVFLDLVANDDEPRETPKEVWRYLAKSLLESGNPEKALAATNHVLAVEENPSWKADGLLDSGRSLFALKRPAEARKAADEALAFNPQGRTSAGLRILLGDLEVEANDLGKAAAAYFYVVNFSVDKDLKPLALWKLSQTLEAQQNANEAAKYAQQLKSEFPSWTPPEKP